MFCVALKARVVRKELLGALLLLWALKLRYKQDRTGIEYMSAVGCFADALATETALILELFRVSGGHII